ncbi:unnamed protein product [Arabidopsis lyrata]|nr:unnamed protein product [Arabidopsis lyrata]
MVLLYSDNRLNLEEPSHRASLMTGGLPFGSSVAPCPVETSTAHGEQFCWDLTYHAGKDMNPWSYASYSDHGQRLFPPILHSSEMIPAPQISSQVSDSRRILLLSWQSKVKLGFSPVDLFSNFGPIPPRRPKPISWFKNLKANILRDLWYAYKGLKNYDLIISNRFCRSVNCAHSDEKRNIDSFSNVTASFDHDQSVVIRIPRG